MAIASGIGSQTSSRRPKPSSRQHHDQDAGHQAGAGNVVKAEAARQRAQEDQRRQTRGRRQRLAVGERQRHGGDRAGRPDDEHPARHLCAIEAELADHGDLQRHHAHRVPEERGEACPGRGRAEVAQDRARARPRSRRARSAGSCAQRRSCPSSAGVARPAAADRGRKVRTVAMHGPSIGRAADSLPMTVDATGAPKLDTKRPSQLALRFASGVPLEPRDAGRFYGQSGVPTICVDSPAGSTPTWFGNRM